MGGNIKLQTVLSRLYRSRFLRSNTRWKALDSHEQRPLVQEDEPVALGPDSEESEEELGQASEPESATVIRETEHFALSPS